MRIEDFYSTVVSEIQECIGIMEDRAMQIERLKDEINGINERIKTLEGEIQNEPVRRLRYISSLFDRSEEG